MKNERRNLKIQTLHAMGEAVKAAQEVLEAERVAGLEGEKLICYIEHVERMEELYDEWIECCLEEIKGIGESNHKEKKL